MPSGALVERNNRPRRHERGPSKLLRLGRDRSNLTRAGYNEEIEKLLGGAPDVVVFPTDPTPDASAFALEKHLEDFLVENWAQTELGRDYDIYTEDGEPVGQQYQTDTGPLDILAVSKDKKRLLVVELKKGRASDAVVGQTLRYMSFVQEELAEEGQRVQAVIIAHEDDQKIRRALTITPSIVFYRYKVSFKLVKGSAAKSFAQSDVFNSGI